MLCIIIAFFTPFFAVSCGSNEMISFSGFDISTNRDTNTNWNYAGFILILFPVILLALSFFLSRIKNSKIYTVCKMLFFIAPLFDIFAVFIVRTAMRAVLLRMLRNMNAGNVPLVINVKYGFVLYIIFNAAVFILASVNYFVKREPITKQRTV